MRLATLTLFCLTLGANAFAARDELWGGVFIAHHVPQAVYTEGVDWCDAYDNAGFRIDTCGDQINTMATGVEQIWYVLASFPLDDVVWCGSEFGFGDITTDISFLEWGACLENPYEISTSGWPGASEGTAVVSTDTPYEGNYFPVYYFVTISYTEGAVSNSVSSIVSTVAACGWARTSRANPPTPVPGVNSAGHAASTSTVSSCRRPAVRCTTASSIRNWRTAIRTHASQPRQVEETWARSGRRQISQL